MCPASDIRCNATASRRPERRAARIHLLLRGAGRSRFGHVPVSDTSHRTATDDPQSHAASSTARRAASSIVGSTWIAATPASASTLPALVRVRAVEAHDDRHVDSHLLERRQDPARDLVAARDAAEDVEEDRAHLRRRARSPRARRRRPAPSRRRRGRRSSPAGRPRPRPRRPSTSRAPRRCRGCRPTRRASRT